MSCCANVLQMSCDMEGQAQRGFMPYRLDPPNRHVVHRSIGHEDVVLPKGMQAIAKKTTSIAYELS